MAKKEVIKQVEVETIHSKYRKHIESAKEGYLTNFDYPTAMEILRWCEDKTGNRLGLNMSCSSCLVGLVEMFISLEEK